jgi:hypothetical protein
LNTFRCKEIVELWAVKTEEHQAFVVKRDNGLIEWAFFREESELDRLSQTLSTLWGLPVEDGSTLDVNDDSGACTLMQLATRCALLPDLWKTAGNF